MSRNASSSAPCESYRRATSTGSPASRRLTKLTPLTTRPPVTSRQGMMRLASTGQTFQRRDAETRDRRDAIPPQAASLPPIASSCELQEIAYDFQAYGTGLFGVELDAVDVGGFEHGGVGELVGAGGAGAG